MSKPDDDKVQPDPPPVRPPTLPPVFPDIAQNPYSELQPAPVAGAAPDKVEGTTDVPVAEQLAGTKGNDSP